MRFVTFVWMILGLAPSFSAEAAFNCNAFWVKYSNGGYLGCDEYLPDNQQLQLGGKSFRFFHYNDQWKGTDEQLQVLTSAVEAVKDSYPVFSKFGAVPSTYFMMVSNANGGDDSKFVAYAEANPQDRTGQEPCPVAIHPAALQVPAPKLKQLIAHELFHCFQGENFPKQIKGPPFVKKEEWSKITSWWAEGTANYFSNLVYPSVNLEFETTPKYQASLPLYLQEVSYSTSAFFQSIGTDSTIDHGDQFLIDFLKSSPFDGDSNKQRTALSSKFQLRRGFFHFAEGLTNGTIVDTSGAKVPTFFEDKSLESQLIEKANKTYALKATPYVVHLVELIFPKGGKYNIASFKGELAKRGLMAAIRQRGSTAWVDLNALDQTIETSCNEKDFSYELLVTSTEDAETSPFTLSIEYEPAECPCQAGKIALDSCFVGNWELDNSVMAQVFAAAGGPAEYKGTEGKLNLMITSDGIVIFDFEGWKHKHHYEDSTAGDISITNTFDGLFKAEVGGTPKGELCLIPRSDQTEVKTIVMLGTDPNPVENTVPNPLSGGGTASKAITPVCTPTQIRYTIPLGDPDGDAVEVQGILNRVLQ